MSRSEQRCWAVALAAVTLVALALRVWQADRLPAYLWWDEAGKGLNAIDVLNGRPRLFWPRSLGQEPLFMYLLAPLVAVWKGAALPLRLTSALVGVMTVVALYGAAKELWPGERRTARWWGLLAAGLWAINYWALALNRYPVRANTLPLVLTLAVVFWLRWVRRPDRGSALLFGGAAGLVLYTYLAARITPLLWPLLFFTLPAAQRRPLWRTAIWAAGAFIVIAAPLGLALALQPELALLRVESALSIGEPPVRALARSVLEAFGVFLGLTGDQFPRHNIPGRPPFSPVQGALFAVGVALALLHVRRTLAGRTLLLWLGVMCLPAILVLAETPHFLRQLGALPPALLLVAWPAARLSAVAVQRRAAWLWPAAALLALWLVGEGIVTTRAYFQTWPQRVDFYVWRQGDIWSYGEAVRARPDALGVVALNPNAPPSHTEYVLEYAFADLGVRQVRADEGNIEETLQSQVAPHAGEALLMPRWRDDWRHDPWPLGLDRKGVLVFYLARESEPPTATPMRGFNLAEYRLGTQLQFTAPGRQSAPQAGFGGQVELVGARFGGAYPNTERSDAVAAAGTSIWAVLSWRGLQPTAHLKAAVDLVDAAGYRLANTDSELLDQRFSPAPEWTPETTVHSYHLIPVPAVQPAGPVRLEARVYDAASQAALPAAGGDSVVLGEVEVLPALQPVEPEELAPDVRMERSLGSGRTLLGFSSLPEQAAPGQTLTLRLYWRLDAAQEEADARLIVRGQEAGGEAAAPIRLPAGPAGAVVRTFADLALPADLPNGSYAVMLEAEGQELALGALEIAGRPRRMGGPPAQTPADTRFGEVVRLVGVDTPAMLRAAPGEAVVLPLFWQVEQTAATDLVRFAHLLGADGIPLAQQDTAPCGGECPAAGWAPGERLVDVAMLLLPEDLPPGSYALGVGWYDADTLQRLPIVSAPDADGLARLPVTVEVATP